VAVTLDTMIGLLASLAVLGYLVHAMLAPEKL